MLRVAREHIVPRGFPENDVSNKYGALLRREAQVAAVENDMALFIDIGAKNSLISLYDLHMDEPRTLGTVMGSEAYQIPTYLAKKRGVGQWFFGNDAMRQVQLNMAIGVENLYERAQRRERIFIDTEEYAASDLLMIYIKKLLALPGAAALKLPLRKLVITVESLDVDTIELFTMIGARLGLSSGTLVLIDHRESFYYYVLSQDPAVYLHDVMLFDYTAGRLNHCLLKRNTNTRPQVVSLLYTRDGRIVDDKDLAFDEIIRKSFYGEIISSAYLIGDGFDGDWMDVSLKRLLKGHRVFVGKNLYSKGACYAGVVKDERKDWPFVYIGENELKLNLSLKVLDKNEMKFITLMSAGNSWYEQQGECEVILDGTPEVECWIQKPDSRQAHIEMLTLHDMPERENRTTRLRIQAEALSDKEVSLKITDLGFGEIVPATNKVWEHTISIDHA